MHLLKNKSPGADHGHYLQIRHAIPDRAVFIPPHIRL